jgi:serine O-acetyltransferase
MIVVMFSLTILDVAIVYLLPVAAIVALWLIASAWVFLLTRLSDGALRGDLEHRVRRQQQKRSGAKRRLSFGYIAASLLGDNCVQATVLHRLAAFLVRHRLRSAAPIVHAFSRFLTHVDISPHAHIGPGLFLYHGLGTVIGKGTHIGRDVTVCQNVTTGGGPTIGNGVKLWAGAKVLGRVSVGDDAEVGANGVVVRDVPSNVVAIGVPATRLLPKSNDAGSVSDYDAAARASW